MERGTLIKLFAALLVVVFIVEMFSIRSSVTSTAQTSTNKTTEPALYAVGNTTATLLSYSDYINVFKTGVDITENASLDELKNIEGVGYINRHAGTLVLVLNYGVNLSAVAGKVKERFPDLNVTANALFSLPPEVEVVTAGGRRNVSIGAVVAIEAEPIFDVGENVSLSLVGLVRGNKFDGAPVAKVIPTEMEVVGKATVDELGGNYSVLLMLPWGRRNVDVSELNRTLSAELNNVNISYAPRSFVVVKGLNRENDTVIKQIYNLSYVTEVNGDLVYVRDDFNDSERIEKDLEGILGNRSIDYTVSEMNILFSSENFSRGMIARHIEGEMVVYRQMFLKLGGRMVVGGREYELPANSRFEVMLLDSFAVGEEVDVKLRVAVLGKRMVGIELEEILG